MNNQNKILRVLGIRPNGMRISRPLILGYLIAFGVSAAVLALLGFQTAAMYLLSIGSAVFVATDVLMEMLEGKKASAFHNIPGVVICMICGATAVACLVFLLRELF